MDLIKSLQIKNFRGFENLQINDFNQINLFVGNNNSGKSSILEALFLTVGMSNPSLPDNINQLRGLTIQKAEEYKYLFHKLDFGNSPEFRCQFQEGEVRNLSLKPSYSKSQLDIQADNIKENIGSTNMSDSVTGLELEFYKGNSALEKEKHKSYSLFNGKVLNNIAAKKYKEKLHAVYITGNSNGMSALNRYSEIIRRKKGDVVLKALQKIDPKIDSIQILNNGLFLSYSDIEELVPVSVAGDGVKKFLNIITSIAEKENSIVLIDEIENGLHYSAHKFLWESIVSIADTMNVQLFITTHNIEAIRCLQEVLDTETYKNNQEKLNVYSLVHTKKAGIKTYTYSYEGLKEAIETNNEIR